MADETYEKIKEYLQGPLAGTGATLAKKKIKDKFGLSTSSLDEVYSRIKREEALHKYLNDLPLTRVDFDRLPPDAKKKICDKVRKKAIDLCRKEPYLGNVQIMVSEELKLSLLLVQSLTVNFKTERPLPEKLSLSQDDVPKASEVYRLISGRGGGQTGR